MKNPDKNQRWVSWHDIDDVATGEGSSRKVLAFCDGLMCVENTFEKGAEGLVHSHPHTQITYVVEGEFLFTIGDESKIVRQGDAMLKQNGIAHGCVCLESGILLDIFTPMREEFI